MFLKLGGGVVVSMEGNCIDSTLKPEDVFAQQVQKMRQEDIKPKESITLEPYEVGHCVFIGEYIGVKHGKTT